jgi:Type IV secretory system Conjugative DNA transfer
MRYFYLSASLMCGLFAAFVTWEDVSVFLFIFAAFCSGWYAYLGLGKQKLPDNVVLEFGGVRWTEEDFCRGWEIDGRTGSGKTASGVVPIIHQLKKNRPEVGILALDTKGDLSEPLARIARDLNCEESLVQLEVRPDNANPDWKPAVTMNFLADASIPYSTYAKILVDVATAAGQKGGQSFFKVAAQTAIQNTFSALAALNRPVTIPACAEIIASDAKYKEMATALQNLSGTKPKLTALVQYFLEFMQQPNEQLGGVRSTVFNYLQPFTAPDIAEVFCPDKPTFSLDAIDQGKLISVKIPQKYQVEKRYVGLLLKVLFYLHALRRYDLPDAERAKKNLIVMILDEAQETVLVSEDGISDYNVIDKIRGARATTINSTQSPTSYIPPMGGRDKAEVFLLNLGNKIYFTAADKLSSEMLADSIGKHTVKKRSYSRTAGKNTTSWREEDEHWIKPHVLRDLPKHTAIIKHCERRFKRVYLSPTSFTKSVRR